jgi:hypothetical protein
MTCYMLLYVRHFACLIQVTYYIHVVVDIQNVSKIFT